MSALIALMSLFAAAIGNAQTRCEAVRVSGITVEPELYKSYTKLKIFDDSASYGELILDDEGLGHECYALKGFEHAGLVMIHHRTAAIGTSVLVQKELLSFYRVSERGLEIVDQIELAHTEETKSGKTTLFRRSFKVHASGNTLRVVAGTKTYLIK